MTNLEIDTRLTLLVKTERKITREILELIVRAERQRLPQEKGFKDTYDWLIRGHGYSGGAANRRIQASRLLGDLPEIASRVENGSLNLTTLWQTQKTIRAQQKASGITVTTAEKAAALEQIEGKTSEAAERQLNALFPDAVNPVEKMVHKRDGGLGISIQLTEGEVRELERSRELLSHAMPGASLSQVIARLAKEYNDRKDPLRKKAAAVPTPQRSTIHTRRAVIQKAGGQCSFTDPNTGKICGSTFQIEIDHILPRAKGGTNDIRNLRCLCRKHNQFMAEIELGRAFMDEKRRRA